VKSGISHNAISIKHVGKGPAERLNFCFAIFTIVTPNYICINLQDFGSDSNNFLTPFHRSFPYSKQLEQLKLRFVM
jgi:hypothetical protein